MTRRQRITSTLTAIFSPAALDVIDESASHAGHAARNGLTPNAETHFALMMTAASFAGQSRVDRQRAVNDALASEFADGLHALRMTLKTLDEG